MVRRTLWAVVFFLLSSEGLAAQVGQFLEASQFTVGASPLAAASGDFNEDGIPDLVVANKVGGPNDHGTVSLLTGNGDGTFTKPHGDYDVGGTLGTIAVGDLNHDGNLDAVVTLPSKADSPNQQVRILLGDGHGNLQPASFFDTGLAPQGVAVQDLNWDGWPDLVVANSGTNTISVLINNHGGALAQVEYTVGSAPWAVAIACIVREISASLHDPAGW